MLGFSASMIESRLGRDHYLVKVWRLSDWDCFAVILKDVYARRAPVGGVVSYDPPKMFRAMILQA